MSFAPKKILVPIDAEPAGDRALADRLVDDAIALAKKLDASLALCFVAVPIVSVEPPPEMDGADAYRAMLSVMEARNAASQRILNELADRASAAGVRATSVVTTRAGSVAQVIVDVAGDEKADLIAMTTHGRRGVQRFLLGSVAERVAHLSRIPVLLLPPAH